ncbi:MAG: hypothetical protein SGPRY_010978 [Prymnesium sp.]
MPFLVDMCCLAGQLHSEDLEFQLHPEDLVVRLHPVDPEVQRHPEIPEIQLHPVWTLGSLPTSCSEINQLSVVKDSRPI